MSPSLPVDFGSTLRSQPVEPDHPSPTPRVLIVEDNEMNQILVMRQVGILGYSFKLASDGREAFQYFQEEAFGLVLTDIQMPEMSGHALALAIREFERERRRPRTPIIAITAHAFPEDLRKCREAGIDESLTKPATLDKIRQVLDRWLPLGARA
jgi:CheY-like chemotaxis protein